MKKIILSISIALFSWMLNGCATRYEISNLQRSVYGQNCRPIASETCPKSGCNKYTLGGRFRELNANNATVTINELGIQDSVIYFHCGAEERPYMVKPSTVSLVKNTINQSATEDNLNQSKAECEYEAHKFTVDTGGQSPSRAYIPTNNYIVNDAQLKAIR